MNRKLRTEPRIEDPDGFYTRLIALHEGLSTEESQQLNCKLILLMANHIGERETLDDILDIGWDNRPRK